MCGLAGIVSADRGLRVSADRLKKMCDAIAHRGPDGEGFFFDGGVGLGHRRLSIVDLELGQQPMIDDERGVALVYNGEVYNYKEIRDELQQLGHRFRTNCDTEVVLQAWSAWGRDCVSRLRGMFAFAIWDSRHQQLFLARDRLGIKPMYYAKLDDGSLVFGSELKALLPIPGLSRSLDYEAIEDYFNYGYVPDPKCILRRVRKLPAGHTLLLDRTAGRTSVVEYWDPVFSEPAQHSDEEYFEQLRVRLDDAVAVRLMADVPLGAFLSGGVDSSSVVASMTSSSASRVKTYSISFGDKDFDETPFSDMVAAQLGTEHTNQQVSLGDKALIDELAWVYDEPFADNSALPTYRLCEMASQHVKVALSGDGGDEVFAGYTWHFSHQRKEFLRRAIAWPALRRLIGRLGNAYPKLNSAPRVLRLKSLLQSMGMDSARSFFQSAAITRHNSNTDVFSGQFRSQLQGYTALDALKQFADKAPDDVVAFAQYIDLKLYLCSDILVKVDRASMAHSLEVRVPVLDHLLIEWAGSLPAALKIRQGEGKYLLKKAMEPRLPEEILYRRKRGFDVPLADWFRKSLIDRLPRLIQDGPCLDLGVFDADRIRDIVAAQQCGKADHSEFLWSVIMFDASIRRILQ